jgi:hypothetical protein
MSTSIISWGGVTPGGFGTSGITAVWPSTKATSGGGRMVDVALIDRASPELTRWEKVPRLRRASPITYYMVEAVEQALTAASGIDRSRVGIIATFFLGCLVYSVRFYRQITDEGRRFGSPVLFPETVFNSPLSHVVATLGLGGPVYSQIGDKSCWATGLRTAECWLRNGDADQVIVLGAEEFEPHELDALHAGGLLQKGLVPAEGAIALLLGRDRGIAQITHIADGHGFDTKSAARVAARQCLSEFSEVIPVMDTATGWTTAVAADALRHRTVVGDDTRSAEGFTISAARDTIQGAQLVQARRHDQLVIPVWGLTSHMAALQVQQASGANP